MKSSVLLPCTLIKHRVPWLLKNKRPLLAVVREFIEPAMSRSTLDRLLRRRDHSRLPVLPKPDGERKPFKAYQPGYVHVDVDVDVDVKYLPQIQGEDKRRYMSVAIDRATR